MRVDSRPSSLVCAFVVALAAVVPAGAHAQACVGFTDVASSNAFCKNVEWLKNRGITTGCTSPTLYCATEDVTRLSMAVFVQRLGNAMTRTSAGGYNSGSSLNIDALPIVCPSAQNTPSFARTAHGVGTVLFRGSGPSMDVSMRIVESIDAGPWNALNTPVASWSSTGNNLSKALVIVLPPRPLTPGTSYSWGLQLFRTAGSSTAGDISGWDCQFHIEVDNRVTTSSPYDEDDDLEQTPAN
jgi:hypothetical protein